MLLPYSARLRQAQVRIVLASLSPRRKELMERIFPAEPASRAATAAGSLASTDGSAMAAVATSGGPVPFVCVPSTFPETLPHSDHVNAASYACATSLAKAKEVWEREGARTHILLAADTVVVRDGIILEKPTSPAHAFEMLRSLSGRTHHVVTGCTLLFHADGPMASAGGLDSSAAATVSSSAAASAPLVCSFSVETDVTFAALSDDTIRMYVESNEPMSVQTHSEPRARDQCMHVCLTFAT
jgi:predicted house-cleaning NTP pyrophosphatase (Maf/HAM1 superfamily)